MFSKEKIISKVKTFVVKKKLKKNMVSKIKKVLLSIFTGIKSKILSLRFSFTCQIRDSGVGGFLKKIFLTLVKNIFKNIFRLQMILTFLFFGQFYGLIIFSCFCFYGTIGIVQGFPTSPSQQMALLLVFSALSNTALLWLILKVPISKRFVEGLLDPAYIASWVGKYPASGPISMGTMAALASAGLNVLGEVIGIISDNNKLKSIRFDRDQKISLSDQELKQWEFDQILKSPTQELSQNVKQLGHFKNNINHGLANEFAAEASRQVREKASLRLLFVEGVDRVIFPERVPGPGDRIYDDGIARARHSAQMAAGERHLRFVNNQLSLYEADGLDAVERFQKSVIEVSELKMDRDTAVLRRKFAEASESALKAANEALERKANALTLALEESAKHGANSTAFFKFMEDVNTAEAEIIQAEHTHAVIQANLAEADRLETLALLGEQAGPGLP